MNNGTYKNGLDEIISTRTSHCSVSIYTIQNGAGQKTEYYSDGIRSYKIKKNYGKGRILLEDGRSIFIWRI